MKELQDLVTELAKALQDSEKKRMNPQSSKVYNDLMS